MRPIPHFRRPKVGDRESKGRESMLQTEVAKLPDGKYQAAPNLRLIVAGTSRRWVFRMQINGKRIERGLGSTATITLAMAKARAAKMAADLAGGKAPEKTKKPKKDSLAKLSAPVFSSVAERAIERKATVTQWKQSKSHSRLIYQVTTFILPYLKDKAITEITRDDVLDVLQPIWYKTPETAKRVRLALEMILDFAVSEGMRPDNPARWKGNLALFLPPKDKLKTVKHVEAPTLVELKTLLRQFFASRSLGGYAIIFGALTACRSNEFISARWDEIDLENAVFSVPPERRKDGKDYPFRVPLSKQALKIIEMLPRKNDFLFPGHSAEIMNRETPRILLQRAAGRPVTMHGCRSTFSDWCAENGKDVTLAEKSLMHATGNTVRQAYQRSDLLEQRRILMQEWASKQSPV